MKYLITGGAGFIGSAIANKLGSNCIVIDNLSTGKIKNLNNPEILIQGDILDKKFLGDVFAKYKPEKVIHLAAQVSVAKSIADPILDMDINIKGTINIFNACIENECRKIVFASSVAVYGNPVTFPITEQEETKPINPYGITKLTTEHYAYYFYKQFDLDYSALRFANVYGPKQNSSGEGGVIAIFVNNIRKNKTLTIFGNGLQTRDFIYVEDVADAVVKFANNKSIGIFNVSTNIENSINNITTILRKNGYRINVVHAASRPGDIERSWLDNTKIKKELNWTPRYDLETGLMKMLKNLK